MTLSGPNTETRAWWKPKPKPRAKVQNPRNPSTAYFLCQEFSGSALTFSCRGDVATFARMFVTEHTRPGTIGAGHDNNGIFEVILTRGPKGAAKVVIV